MHAFVSQSASQPVWHLLRSSPVPVQSSLVSSAAPRPRLFIPLLSASHSLLRPTYTHTHTSSCLPRPLSLPVLSSQSRAPKRTHPTPHTNITPTLPAAERSVFLSPRRPSTCLPLSPGSSLAPSFSRLYVLTLWYTRPQAQVRFLFITPFLAACARAFRHQQTAHGCRSGVISQSSLASRWPRSDPRQITPPRRLR